VSALGPWATGEHVLNFADKVVDPATGYAGADYDRLRAIRAEVDPRGVFQANHEIA
jgi:FAD/FMN-containing dehydrogenase